MDDIWVPKSMRKNMSKKVRKIALIADFGLQKASRWESHFLKIGFLGGLRARSNASFTLTTSAKAVCERLMTDFLLIWSQLWPF